MADIRGFGMDNPKFGGEFGNSAVHRFGFRRAAMTSGDVFLFGVIPAGHVIVGAELSNTASTATSAMAIGFRNADGTITSPDDGGATFQSPAVDYFFTAAAAVLTAAGRLRWRAPGAIAGGLGTVLRLNKDIIIIGTLSVATIAVDTLIDLVFDTINVGVK